MFSRWIRRTLSRWGALVFLSMFTWMGVCSGPVVSRAVPARYAEAGFPATETVDPARARLQQGVALYEAGRFTDAIAHYQQSLPALPGLYQALALSHLSLAHQQLGQWDPAEQAIARALTLLNQHSRDPAHSEILARTLNTQARLQWLQGQSDAALNTWQQAAIAYRRARDATGIVLSLINRANALQSLGFTVQAADQLQQVAQVLQQQTDPALKATGLRSLGNALRRMGRLSESRSHLQTALHIAQTSNLTMLQGQTLLDLGNAERALWEKAIAIGRTAEAQQWSAGAIAHYQQASAIAPASTLQLQAQLNQLSLRVALNQPTAAAALAATLPVPLARLSPSRSHIFAQLNFASSLMALSAASEQQSTVHFPEHSQSASQKNSGHDSSRDSPAHWLTVSADMLTTALQNARALEDAIAQSYVLGQLGALYERTGQWQAAEQLTRQAWQTAETLQAAAIRYRWEWQLGRLRARQGDRPGAIASYSAAVNSLKAVRGDLLQVSADVQFSFRDDVEPLYRGLVELLVTTEDGAPPRADDLRQAIQQVDALQLAELENFLRCDLAQTVQLPLVAVDPGAAKLYPMILGDRLAVVLELPGPNQPLQYAEIRQPRAAIESTLRDLRQALGEPDQTPEAIAGLRQLYDWLIAPFEPALARSAIKTLVFVPDGELRNIPMAALFDGETYLVSRYSVAIAPRLALFRPERRSPNFSVFLGGIGEAQTIRNRAFPEIKNLSPELETIQQLVNARSPLLNADFTETNLEQRLQTESFSAIHLKTHGVFSSDPEETFIVAYRDLITSQDLGRLLQTRRLGDNSSLELLVLSACSTAQGDNRAVLGLAGIAVQAGARSAVSTLWEAQDFPNTQLMIRFYQALRDPQISRAEALRRAQLSLIEQGYTAPHVWATYVLVGNWL